MQWFDQILFQTRAYSARPAIVAEDKIVTYEMLRLAIQRCGSKLIDIKIPSHQPVGILVKNPMRHLSLALALFYIGVPSISLAEGISDIGPQVLSSILVEDESDSSSVRATRKILVKDEWFAIDTPFDEVGRTQFYTSSQICRFGLTSGTTGRPKLVPYTAQEIGSRIAEKVFPSLEASVRSVLCMPGLTSNFGFTSALAALSLGRSLFFPSSTSEAIRMIELYSIDFAMLSTEQLLALTRTAKCADAQLGSLRTVVASGSAPSRTLIDMASLHLCKDIRFRYSSSETGLIAQTIASDIKLDPNSVGYVIPGVNIGIFNDLDEELGPDVLGIVKVRRNDILDIQEIGSPKPDSWIALGDLGKLSADNRLYIYGRIADGHNNASLNWMGIEVEHTLRLEWGVGDAACVVLAGDETQSSPSFHVAVVDKGLATPSALRGFTRRQGIDFPIEFQEVSSIPRGVNGKVDRLRLRALARELKVC